jgi:DNA-directed RNA polymerase specialized sigma24 family protein
VQLLKLLKTMAQNKLIDKARKHEPEYGSSQALDSVAEEGDTPSQIVAWDEMLQKMRQLLTEEERYLANERGRGREWSEIAADLNASPEALRKRLDRAMNRVAERLGLDRLQRSL